MGCSKQNISYWSAHSYSTQAKNTIYDVIWKASVLFDLDKISSENLANSAGLSNEYIGGSLVDNLGYTGKIAELCKKAAVSERMLRLYNHKTPTKHTIIALAIATEKSCVEIDELLRKYGYCLSDSIIIDAVVKWYTLNHKIGNTSLLLAEINETLDQMGLPLIMTKIN